MAIPLSSSFYGSRFTRAIFLTAALFYLGFHVISGERGLFAWFKETRRHDRLMEELSAVNIQNEKMERRVKGLSGNTLDLDLLDEQVRKVLGYSAANEMAVPSGPPHPK